MNDCSAGCAGGQFPAGQGGSYNLVDTLSTKHRSHRRRLLSYSVSMVASRFDLRKQVKLGGAIFPPGIQGSKGPRGPEQSSSRVRVGYTIWLILSQPNIVAIWCRLLSYSVPMVASRFDLRKQDKLGGDIFLPGIQGSKGPRGPEQSSSVLGQGGSYSLVDTLSTKHRRHRCRLLSYSVSMVASRFDLRKQDKLGGAIFPPGIQGSKGPRGPEQSSSVRPLL
ncbi:hypothetical protein CLU79DRAFT_888301 [Phycomyces nitens]|nr:hypothetical protein CLU79DRAFT_888301 [Phycomyces nitens]